MDKETALEVQSPLVHGEFVEDGRLGPVAEEPKSWEVIPEDMQGEFVRLPAQLSRALGVYADAASQVLRAEDDLERIEAEVTLAIRRSFLAVKPKPTEAIYVAVLKTNPAYRVACENVTTAKAAKLRAHADVESLKAKRDMLISLGAHIRAELQGDPSIRDRKK